MIDREQVLKFAVAAVLVLLGGWMVLTQFEECRTLGFGLFYCIGHAL